MIWWKIFTSTTSHRNVAWLFSQDPTYLPLPNITTAPRFTMASSESARLGGGMAQMSVSTALQAPPNTDMTDISEPEDGDGDDAEYPDDYSDEKTERTPYPPQPEIYCPICTVEYGQQSADNQDDKDAYVEGPLCLGCGQSIGTRCYEMIISTAERKEKDIVCPFYRAPLERHDYHEDGEMVPHDEHM